MKSKIIGFALWAAAIGSIAYSQITGQEQYSAIGVAMCWILVFIFISVFLVQVAIYAVGKPEDKAKVTHIYLSRGAVGRFFSWIQAACMFVALCISGFIITAIFYLICAILMACVGFCVRENAKKKEAFTA